MVINACADPNFCQRGGGGSKPKGEKTVLIFYVCFFSPKFSGDAGGPTIYGGGGGPNANFYRI